MPVDENENSLFIGDFEYTLSDRLANLEIIDGALPEFLTPIPNLALSKDTSMSFECELNVPLFERMANAHLIPDMICAPANGATLVFSTPYSVQRRKHHKKRINKKWAKRYGFKTVYKNVRLEDVTYNLRGNGEIDILGKEFVVK